MLKDCYYSTMITSFKLNTGMIRSPPCFTTYLLRSSSSVFLSSCKPFCKSSSRADSACLLLSDCDRCSCADRASRSLSSSRASALKKVTQEHQKGTHERRGSPSQCETDPPAYPPSNYPLIHTHPRSKLDHRRNP